MEKAGFRENLELILTQKVVPLSSSAQMLSQKQASAILGISTRTLKDKYGISGLMTAADIARRITK